MSEVVGKSGVPSKGQGFGGATVQRTVRVNGAAVAVLESIAAREDVKLNRLFDEAVQVYAAMLTMSLRIKKEV
jgi:hypothetical protein